MAKLRKKFGALLDPITDRVFALVGVSVFLFEGRIDTWEYFVMISRDIMTVPDEEIRQAKVAYTIIGGKVVFTGQ